MKITINTPAYNERRYGKPYIGIVNPVDGKVSAWGRWIGTAGEAGILEIEAQPGAVIVKGQKDNRGNNSTPNYAVITDDGDREYMSKAEAIKKARERAAKPADPLASLRAEREGLLARIAEIDVALAQI